MTVVTKKTDSTKEQIRCLISSIYDLQKLRIASGNRLTASFYIGLGVEPSTSPDDVDKQEASMIKMLKWEYSRISDGIAEKKKSINKQIAELNKSDTPLQYIRNELDYKLVDAYMLLLKSEEESVKILEKYVKSHPLWDAFFANVRGAGPLMAGVCIAYLDIYKARHVSSFFRYCGLDTVRDTDENGNQLYIACEGELKGKKVKQKVMYLEDGVEYTGKVTATTDFDAEGNQIFLGENGEKCIFEYVQKEINGGIFDVYVAEDGTEYTGRVRFSEHGRRKGDTEMVDYVSKDGETKQKRSITYCPELKTKLMGVLTGTLIKAKDPTYSTIYYDYKDRLLNNPDFSEYSLNHVHMMALRYMIKQFLRDLWTTWRKLEGLEVDMPYEVAKLNRYPHKYNRYQCIAAGMPEEKVDKLIEEGQNAKKNFYDYESDRKTWR